jgi:hypothetical protein
MNAERMATLAEEILIAESNYREQPNNLTAQAYLNGLLMAQAILLGEIE